MAGLTKSKKAKGNIFKRYFSDFGIKQMADILIILGAIAIIVGLCVYKSMLDINYVTLAGAAVCLVGLILRSIIIVNVFKVVTNKRAPEYKQALINAVITGVMILLSVAIILISIVVPVTPA